MSEITMNAAKIARLAYGYELMFSALCNIAGTSGGTTHWFTQKGQEVTARVDPLWKLTDESNAHKPGDCLSQHVPYAAWAVEVERKAAALDHWRQESGKLHSQIAIKEAEIEALRTVVQRAQAIVSRYEEPNWHAFASAALKGDAA